MKKKNVFKWAYLSFLAVLVLLVIAASVYVYNVLSDYENAQPEYKIQAVMAELKSDAANAEDFWGKYALAEVVNSEFEKDINLKNAYLQRFFSDELNYTMKNGSYGEDQLCFSIRDGKTVLAEIMLKAEGDITTKLAVYSWRNWQISSVTPIFESKDYEISIPEEFTLSVNGNLIPLDKGEEAEGKIKYTIGGVYLQPEIIITDGKGQEVHYVIRDNKVMAEYYDYTLTLPYTLNVTVNGEKSVGTALANGNIRHDIMLLDKPEVVISDLYGNSILYEGKEFPLTYMTVISKNTDIVKIDGMDVAEGATKISNIPEYDILSAILENIPKRCEYNIAVLKDDAEITFSSSESSDTITLDDQVHKHDMMSLGDALDEVPIEVGDKVDVLQVAQNWSLYMSNDFSFKDMAELMLKDSYQYEVARKYNNSIDKTMFSDHTLLSPAFTDSKVENFTWITEDSFSVEISFVKHMRLSTNQLVDDAMNDRFYFVNSQGKWLLVGMKEVSKDGE